MTFSAFIAVKKGRQLSRTNKYRFMSFADKRMEHCPEHSSVSALLSANSAIDLQDGDFPRFSVYQKSYGILRYLRLHNNICTNDSDHLLSRICVSFENL